MPSRRSKLAELCAVLFVFALGACSGSEATTRLEAVADTVSGVPRLTYPERSAPALGWRLDTVAVIGGFAASGDEYQFDQVRAGGVAGDAAGNLYVLDGAGKRVLGYDAAGELVGVWGGEGNGPGELANPGGLGVAADGTLWVPDQGNGRVTLFPTGAGEEPRSIPLPDDAGGIGGAVSPSGDGLYGVLMTFSFRPGDETGPPPLPLVHMSGDGTYDDTLWVAERPPMDRVEARTGNRMMLMLVQQAFAPGFYWDRFADGTFAVAEGPEYLIHLVDASGRELRRIRRDPAARAPTAEDMEAEKQRQRDMAPPSNIPGAEQLMEKRLEALTFADRIPRITGLAVDTRNRLWVGVSVENPGETDRIDVYDREGNLLGELDGVPEVPVEFYGDGLVARLTSDDLDVQQLVVYRLVEGPGD